MLNIFVSLIVIFLIGACRSSHTKYEYGLQNELSTYLPARILVMPCGSMPEKFIVDKEKKRNLAKFQNNEDIKKLCTKFDDFILKGFENQPFMRGFSPRAARKILSDNKAEDLLENPWKRFGDPKDIDVCKSCSNSIEVYMNTLLANKEWLFWLAELSLNTKHSDAILFPLITWGYTSNENSQGIESFSRFGKIELILIDVNSGKVIWARERSARVMNKRLSKISLTSSFEEKNNQNDFLPPDLDVLTVRLFQDDLWRDFPGRLNYK